MAKQLWEKVQMGGELYTLMNLEHPEVDARVRADMDAGVAVYYDRRWETAALLSEWLLAHPEQMSAKRVLVLGAGVGAEALVLGRHSAHVWLNDLSPVALELCARQMAQNGMANYTTLLGRYEDLELPAVDLVVASFLVYNKDTSTAMRAFLAGHQGDLILVNERLDPFRKFLKAEPHTEIFKQDGIVGVLLQRG